MAGASLLALIDDISLVLDDVAVMAKIAAKKTAGVLGDDLALNAEQVIGVKANRELPVVWAVAKGSLLNKVILVPLALFISNLYSPLVTVLLMLGAIFLSFEGAEKVLHKFYPMLLPDDKNQHDRLVANADENIDLLAFEKEKIKGAIRTDFILSAEIVVIALGVVVNKPLLEQALVLSLIAFLITVGVYGLVAGIVKLDDIGLYLLKKPSQTANKLGSLLLAFAPKLMKFLSIVGTLAMFLVGGGILVHSIHFLHHGIENIAELSGIFSGLTTMFLNAVVGLLVGLCAVAMVSMLHRLKQSISV